MEQKNFLLAMALIVGFLFLWSVVVVPRFTPRPTPAPTTAAQEAVIETQPKMEISSAHKRQGEPVVLKDAILRDAGNEIVITPKGGAIKTWRLKLGGKEMDMVLSPDAETLPLASFPEVSYSITVQESAAIMQASLGNGLRVTKTLALAPTGHLHKISYKFTNTTSRAVTLPGWSWGWGPGLGTDAAEMKENASVIRVIQLGKLKVHTLKADMRQDLEQWAAIDNRYYLVAFLPLAGHAAEVSMAGAKDQTQMRLTEKTVIPAGGQTEISYDLYVGPKGYTALKKYGRHLENSVDFGWFTSLGRLILNALYYFRALTGNYGLAIILLTIVIQILMLPLTIKSFKATLAMKKLQPKIAEIQARYKSDPKRLNVEMMNVYKTSGTNPFGGCLPMLLQMPIFLALFNTLRNAYELRGTPFVGWIHDLSVPDVITRVGSIPVHVLPLVMGGAMYFQQRMSGAVSDPTQRHMMTLMPIMFTFMFYGFPSGLVLYWLTQNLMTMATQWGFERITRKPSQVVETTLVKE